VQYVYLAMSVFGVILNVLLIFAKLPEVAQVVAADASQTTTIKGFLKQKHTIYGFFAEFGYVGAQVAVASNTIFYLRNQPGISQMSAATASNMFSACQAVFTVGRFIGVGYLRYIDPCFALFVNGVGLVIFSILTSVVPGKGKSMLVLQKPVWNCTKSRNRVK
jgi:FHS family L-fucose permease-like MFS transporter